MKYFVTFFLFCVLITNTFQSSDSYEPELNTRNHASLHDNGIYQYQSQQTNSKQIASQKTTAKGIREIGLGYNPFKDENKMAVWVIEETDDLPIGVIEYQTPKSQLSMQTEITEHLVNITTHKHIHLHASGRYKFIKAKFSGDYDSFHNHLTKSSYKMAHTQANIHLYTLQSQIEMMTFTPSFTKSINEILWCLEKNTTRSRQLATYKTDQLLNFYGTHVRTKVVMGGTCNKYDFIDTNEWSDYEKTQFSASVKVSFAIFFSIKGSYEVDHTVYEKYLKSNKNTQVYVTGGLPWSSNETYNEWAETLFLNPIPVDYYHYPISYVLRAEQFENTNREVFRELIKLIEKRTMKNVVQNTHYGCMDPKNPNFDFIANVDDPKRCAFNLTENFGGVFQVSNYPYFQLKNELTQNYSCPEDYKAYPIQDPVSHTVWCHRRFWLWDLKYKCYNGEEINSQLYVCLNQGGSKKGMYFGGAYTNKVHNRYTNGFSCPDGYYDRFAPFDSNDKTKGIHFCTAPYDSGDINMGLHVGGFFSGFKPNPFTKKFVCPNGYKRVTLGFSFYSEEFVYCVGIHDFDGELMYIPPGYGHDIPSLVDYYWLEKEQYYLVVNISVPESYEEQYHSLSEFLNATYHNKAIDAWNLIDDDKNLVENNQDKNDNTKKTTSNSHHSNSAIVVLSLCLGLMSIAFAVLLFVTKKKQKEKNDPEKRRILYTNSGTGED
ncbi:hypothetical protein M0813_15944 [Anaeramoeba flamelloides]|uniref:MACPF domain-containing protein n=1 Tax=Anaeramoeba flamelloides TaxID=1746091 RepID=A0ABQ8Z0P8_9EUKA|nr:hypothetical protein M0813_15944 [Anaeramoeba flamelloides]